MVLWAARAWNAGVVVDPPVTQPDQSTSQTVSEPAGEDFSTDPSRSGRVAVGDKGLRR